jgi:uncharacterized protein DUF4169
LLHGVLEHQDTIPIRAASQTLCVAGLSPICRQFIASLLHEMGNIMGDLVNFKRFKKRTARDQSDKQAEVNRTKFGRSKTERVLDEQRASRANIVLSQHLIDSEDAP